MNGTAKTYRAGVEIRPADGWKTACWRYPGDAGIPPRFDFSLSTNVKSVTVRWPAPHPSPTIPALDRLQARRRIPARRHPPRTPAKPVNLALSIEYAICEKLYVPADGKAELKLYGKSGEQDERIAKSCGERSGGSHARRR